MRRHNIETLLLQRSNNFAWLTDGAASYVGIASDVSPSHILITLDNQYIITNNIEAKRLQEEEGLGSWNFIINPWQEGNAPAINKMVKGQLHSDFYFPNAIDVSNLFSPMRFNLDQQEIERFKILGKIAAAALESTALSIQTGMSELEISALLSKNCYASGVIPIVNLVAVDERIDMYRHPLPTTKKMERCAAIVLGARKWGLVSSATRFIHFGKLSNNLRDEVNSCARIASSFIKASTVNTELRQVLDAGISAYKKEGVENTWNQHHQGGLTGFTSREVLATQSASHKLNVNQAFAWNPTLISTKSEDTYIITENGPLAITQSDSWPMIEVDGVKCADILIR